MDSEKWQEVKRVFGAALEQPAASLASFLDTECGADAALRAEVARLIVNHFSAGEFLQHPIIINQKPPSLTVIERASADQRFELRAKVGSGSFGDVYEAFDREKRCVVAVKYLRECAPEHWYRLKREFRTLSDIQHPNVIQVFELFSSAHPPFFTMEVID